MRYPTFSRSAVFVVIAVAALAIQLASALAVETLVPDMPSQLDPVFDPPLTPVFTSIPVSVRSAVPQSDGKIVLCGDFQVDPKTPYSGLLRVNIDGSLDTTFPPRYDFGLSATQPDGKILQADAGLRRLNADGSVDSSFAAPSVREGGIKCIAIQADGKILVGGSFNSQGAILPTHLIRLNKDGSVDPTFNPGAGPDEAVNCIVVASDGTVLIGGEFTHFDRTPISRIARLQTNGALDASFDPGTGADDKVNVLAVQRNGQVLLGGLFQKFNSITAGGFARINTDGSLDTTFKPRLFVATGIAPLTDGEILMVNPDGLTGLLENGTFAFARPNKDSTSLIVEARGSVLITGDFTQVSDASRPGIARLINQPNDIAESVSSPAPGTLQWMRGGLLPEVNQVTFEISIDGSTWNLLGNGQRISGGWQWTGSNLPAGAIIRARGVVSINGISTYPIERIQALPTAPFAGSNDPTFSPLTTNNSSTFLPVAVQPDGKVVSITLPPASGVTIVRLNPDGTPDPSFSAQTGSSNDVISGLAIQADGKIVIAGTFTQINSTARNNLARLNPDGSIDSTFNSSSGANGPIYCLAIQSDEKILLGGAFTSVNGTPVSHISRLNVDGSVDHDFSAPPATATINCIVCQPDQYILVSSGDFVRRLNPDGASDSTFTSLQLDSLIDSIALQADGKILIGGDVSLLYQAGFPPSGTELLLRLNPDGHLDTTFAADAALLTEVSSIAVQTNGDIIVGSATNPLRLHPDGMVDTAFQTNPLSPPGEGVTLKADGSILFSTQDSLAAFHNEPATEQLLVLDPTQIAWRRSGTAPVLESASFEVTTDGGVTWTPLGSGTYTQNEWWIFGLNLPASGSIRARGHMVSATHSSSLVEYVQAYTLGILSPITVASSNADPTKAKLGDSITLSFASAQAIQTPTVIMGGQSASVSNPTGNTWQATVNVTNRLPSGVLTFSIVLLDLFGNALTPITATTDGSQVMVYAAAPIIDTSKIPRNGYEEGMPLPDFRHLVSATTVTGTVSITQSPAPATVLTAGLRAIEFTASDEVGNTTTETVTLKVVPNMVSISITAFTESESIFPVHTGFGVPELGIYLGTESVDGKKSTAIISPNGNLLAVTGNGPLSNWTVNPVDNGIVYPPSGNAYLERIPKQGTELTVGNSSFAAYTGEFLLNPTAALKEFLAIDGNGPICFFMASLKGPGVGATNNVALFANTPLQVDPLPLIRKGDRINGKIVKVIGVLTGSKGTLADERWRIDDLTIGVRLTFTDNSEALYEIPVVDALSSSDWILDAETGHVTQIPGLNGTTISSFGLPGFGTDGVAALAKLADGQGGATAANDVALIFFPNSGTATVLARKGDPVTADANGAPLTGVTLTSFSDPIAGADGAVACLVTMSSHGVGRPGIWYAPLDDSGTIIANVGAAAPGGGHWAGFSSVVLPKNPYLGPIFLGTLAVNAADQVTVKNNLGLWGMDSLGTLRLLFRTGQSVTVDGSSKTVRTFRALQAAPGSIGAASGYDDDGNVAIVATFTDGNQALLQLTVP